MRARYREDDRVEKLITTKDPLPYSFRRFPFVARRLQKGSRVRVVFEPINSIYAQRNYNAGGVVSDEDASASRTVTVALYHDLDNASVVRLPIGATE